MNASGRHLDRQEIRDPEERERSLFHALPGLIQHAVENCPYFSTALAGMSSAEITSRNALADLPILRKDDIMQAQRLAPPFGGMSATPLSRLTHIFCSPGPIYDPEGGRSDYWRFARALFAAGFRQGDLVHNTFSYHMTPAGLMIDSAARSLGCPVFPAGIGQTDRQVEIINDLKPQAYVGTPSFLLILLERAAEMGADVASLEKALVSGEAFSKAVRERLITEFGVHAFECYGTADAGLIAYESEAREGLILDESIILEIVRPGTNQPVNNGEVGEVVVTLFNPDYPLIRFATGDLSCVLPGVSSCGRTNLRIGGWMGRADQRTKIRGMFVDPAQIHALSEKFAWIGKCQLVVDLVKDLDRIVLRCEVDDQLISNESHKAELKDVARMMLGLRCDVEMVQLGSLPNNGKVIDDQRQLS